LVVGIPSDIAKLIKQKRLCVQGIRIFALDNTDEMLSLGFMAEIVYIFQALPIGFKTCLVTKSMTTKVLNLESRILSNAVRVMCNKEGIRLDQRSLKHYNIRLHCQQKLDTLCRILKQTSVDCAIVYCNTWQRAEMLQEMLCVRGHSASWIHEKMDVVDQQLVLRDFRLRLSRVLVATIALPHVANTVPLLINFEFPQNCEIYLRRTACAVRQNKNDFVVINFVMESDMQTIRKIEQILEEGLER